MNMSLREAKADLAKRTQFGLSTLLASLVIWIAFVLLTIASDDVSQEALVYTLGAISFWPLVLVIGRVIKRDVLARGNPLSVLYWLLCGLQLPFVPVLLSAASAAPETVPWYLGVIVGVQFLLFAWLYDSSAFLFCALGIIEVAILIGWLSPRATYLATPLAILAVLLISILFLQRQIAANERTQSGIRPNP